MAKFAIIGAGNAGLTMAAHLKQVGGEVSLYDVVEAQLTPIIDNNRVITVSGINLVGAYELDQATMNLAEAIEGAELIVCVTPAHTHKFVARDLADHLVSGQILMLHPGRTGGALEVHKVLKEENCRADILVIEAQTLLYAARKDGASVNLFGLKKQVSCAGLPNEESQRFFDLIQPLIPQFVPAPTIWHTSLHNIGMLFHPTPTLLNLGRMESKQPFEYYTDGFTPSIAGLVEKLDAERLAVAAAMGVTLPSVVEWLESSYGVVGQNLYQALQVAANYQGIAAPLLANIDDKKRLRYVIEDVPTGLVPVSALGKKFDVETPAIDTIINLANILFEADFRASGRNLDQLGLSQLSQEEIITL
ncbi:MAG: NAD/NADP octopine/nopaline dehydrogenase family protein [Anaerolineae bacterium]|nr:NAD/NADP octopine/nopaline dehydrogenase family protein [Anaerolineae bacterium]